MVIYFKDNSQLEVSKEQFVKITAQGITVISQNLLTETHYSWKQVEKVIS